MKKYLYIVFLISGFCCSQTVINSYAYQQASTPSPFDGVYEFLFQGNLNETTGNHPATNINGTITYTTGPNAIYPQAGVFNGSFFFDLAASSDFSVTNFTIALWMRKTGSWTASWQEMVEHGRGVNGNSNWYYVAISGTSANSLTNRWSNNGDDVGRHTTNTTNFGALDTWYHVVFTVNGTTATTYVNGIVNTESTGITLGTPALAGMRIGAFQEGGEEYVGYMAALKFYPSGKTLAQAQAIYDCDNNGTNCGNR
ncbi:LamG-like jellyroll fold domain-containing protein [Flagellimonas sp.]|uniref:LamG-like jellyroll fold domain-containing protein n=1 Tax=Flagellimonas sp. TaxID=2058762 RepID=UPI003F49F0A5